MEDAELVEVVHRPQVHELAKDEERGPQDPPKLGDFVVLRAVFLAHRDGAPENGHVHDQDDNFAHPEAAVAELYAAHEHASLEHA